MPTDPDLHISYEDVGSLVERDRNPKRHDIAAIQASIRRHGFVAPLIRNESDQQALVGLGRARALAAMRDAGETQPEGIRLGDRGEWLVPVVRGVEMVSSEALAYVIADNHLVETGGWDEATLADILTELNALEEGLQGTGFGADEVDRLVRELAPHAHLTDTDAIPSPEPDPRFCVGSLWRLGSHRLLIGDATSPADVERVLDGARPAAAATDPPYNVDLPPLRPEHHRLLNDNLDRSDWAAFVAAWVRNLLRYTDGAIYSFMSSKEWPVVAAAFQEAGAHWSDTLIWAKDRFVLGRADHQRQYEPIWYGWRDGSAHQWHGGRDQSDLLFIPRPTSSDLHPTMKPVALMSQMISNSTTAGDAVLDLFAGSGSTIIACEDLNRRCYALELDPYYAQVAVARWEEYTGQVATKLA